MALRLEAAKTVALVSTTTVAELPADEWRRLAVQTADRLKHAETKLKDQSAMVDELRDRHVKAQKRLDSVGARADALQVELVAVTAERDDLKARMRNPEQIKRQVWDFAQHVKDELDAMKDEVDVRIGEILGTL